MGLPNVFSKKQNQENDLFISILLTEKSVSSALWRAVNQGISILNQSKPRFFQTDEERLIQFDESLQDLGKESEQTDQALFALEPEWASQTKIKESYDQQLQSLCKDLSLDAVGFVLTTEALINHLLQKNQYLSSLVLYVGAAALTLITINQGKQEQTLSVGRSDNILSDVKEALARLNEESQASGQRLPLNIILASACEESEQISKYQQQLLAIDWTREFGLVQTPKIEFVSPDNLLEMVVKHAGLAVARDQGLVVSDPQQESYAQGVRYGVSGEESSQAGQNQKGDYRGDEDSVKDKAGEGLPTSFGVPITQTQPPAGAASSKLGSKAGIADTEQEKGPGGLEPDREKGFAASLLGRLLGKKRKPKRKGKKSFSARDGASAVSAAGGSNLKKNKIKLIALVGAFLGLLVSAGLSYFFLANSYKVLVEIKPNMQVLDKEVVITLDSQIDSSDPQQSLLKADLVYEEVSDTESVQTTGVTLVGEEAQGEVRILNKTEADKTFSRGTVLSVDSLEFVLDEEVVVPASTIEIEADGDSERKEYGRKDAAVTAKEIGTESNISEDTDLRVETFSDDTYSARAISDFEGGSSREIRVVAEDDLEELLVSLRQRLIREAREKLSETKSSDNQVVPTDNYEIVSQDYSAEVGDEEDDVSLSLTLRLQGLSYDLQDLNDLAKAVLEDDLPDQYRFLDDQEDLLRDVKEIKGEDNQVMIEAEITASVEGLIDEDELRELLTGLSIQEAGALISEHERISNYEISISPRIAANFFKSIPQQTERVVIKID